METKQLLLGLCLALFAISNVSAQNNKIINTEFAVGGNCGMCKKKIESSLKGQPGVASANWDIGTKIIQIAFDSTKISTEQIQQKIADAGYDTENIKASDRSYNSLMGCCKYKRILTNKF